MICTNDFARMLHLSFNSSMILQSLLLPPFPHHCQFLSLTHPSLSLSISLDLAAAVYFGLLRERFVQHLLAYNFSWKKSFYNIWRSCNPPVLCLVQSIRFGICPWKCGTFNTPTCLFAIFPFFPGSYMEHRCSSGSALHIVQTNCLSRRKCSLQVRPILSEVTIH